MKVLGKCWSCVGPDPDCKKCHGRGVVPVPVRDAMHRRKEYLGSRHPLADANGNEKWVRLCAEVPPEVFQALERVQRESLGVNAASATRPGLVRAGLVTYLDAYGPKNDRDPAIDTEAEELPDAPELEAQTGRFRT